MSIFLNKLPDQNENLKQLKNLNFVNENNEFNRSLYYKPLNDDQKYFLNELYKLNPDLKHYKLSDIILLYRKNYHLNNLKCYANEFNINCNKPRLIKYRQLYNFCQDHNKNKKLINLKKYKEIKKSVKNKYGVDNISQIQSVKEKKKKTFFKNFGTENFSQVHYKNIEKLIKNTLKKIF